MAHKAESFKVNDEKQTIIIYSNVEVPAGEKFLIDRYLDKGYTPLFEEKKKSKTVPEMRKELKAKDKEAYEEFVKLQCRDPEWFFKERVNDYQILVQLEECEETDDEINCVDVKNEWWIINPNFEEV